MLLDAKQEDGRVLETDLCIIGAGAAGITIAKELADSGLRIVLLESGGRQIDPETQELYEGEMAGPVDWPHYLATSRVRAFGGTTAVWGGTCRPLDPIDFEPREWLPHSGWPFSRAELTPYFLRAAEILEIRPFDRETVDGQLHPGEDFAPQDDEAAPVSFVPKILYRSPPTRFGDRYGDELVDSSGVVVVFWANVVRIGRARDGDRIEQVDVRSLSGSRLSVRARGYVLAAGGIENARLLLSSNDVEEAGLGNRFGNVGRYFMDHAHLRFVGRAVWSNPGRRTDVRKRSAALERHLGHPIYSILSPTEAVQRREELLNGGVRLMPVDPQQYRGAFGSQLGLEVTRWAAQFDGEPPIHEGQELDNPLGVNLLRFYLEDVPNPESRIHLVDQRDALGLRQVRVDWRPTPRVLRSVGKYLDLFAHELGRAGLGRAEIVLDEEGVYAEHGLLSHHHTGSTRMHVDPKQGVVDGDCRLHGATNLWVTGSSVFPTTGFANPTMTIVALALRLAGHLRRELGR